MCLAIPAQLVHLFPDSDMATADITGIRRNVNIGLLENVSAGDWVLIHVGFAISKVDEEEARASLEFLRGLGDAYRDELAAFEAAAEEPQGGGAP
jgi:hydrogenase expression/formation protein HypC